MSLCGEAISFDSHRHVKSIQSIWEVERNNLLQSSKSFLLEKEVGGG